MSISDEIGDLVLGQYVIVPVKGDLRRGEYAGRTGMARVTELCGEIGAEIVDTVLLADRRRVMVCDDTGMLDGKPVNGRATELYRMKAPESPWCIHGDVAVTLDENFGD